MPDLESVILRTLCTGLGEGNSNIDNLTKQVSTHFPSKDPNDLKKDIVETLGELVASGQMQIVTTGWEIGHEFLYICSKRL